VGIVACKLIFEFSSPFSPTRFGRYMVDFMRLDSLHAIEANCGNQKLACFSSLFSADFTRLFSHRAASPVPTMHVASQIEFSQQFAGAFTSAQ
jgi:hypothetical protein